MKRWRVLASASVLIALVLFAFLVPVPVSRIRGQALVQADPSATGKVYVRRDGILTKLNVRPGDTVVKDEVIAEFRDPELEAEIVKYDLEKFEAHRQLEFLRQKFDQTNDRDEKSKITKRRGEINSKYLDAKERLAALEKIRDEELRLRAPCSGTIGFAPSIEEVTRLFPQDPLNPFCTINQPGHVRVCLPIVTPDYNRLRQDLEQLSSAALRTRRLLIKRKVTVAYDNTRLADVLADLQKQVKGLHWTLDQEAGVNEDLTVTYHANDQRLGMVLDALFGDMGLGFVILSEPDTPRDGHLLIRPGRERGDPEGGRVLADLDVTIRVKGHDSRTWKGKIHLLPESEAKTVPLMLSNRQSGPVAVKAGAQADKLVPTTQQYLVYVDIVRDEDNPNETASIVPGTAAQVKIYCQPETCAHWVWRWLNETFDLGLM